jgi:HAD superfamily hydrolase (TIGR01509 family)
MPVVPCIPTTPAIRYHPRVPIKAIIFDFDGLILDTETPELRAWQELYAEHGYQLPMDLWIDCIGRPHGHFDPYSHLIQLNGKPLDRETLRARRRARSRELILQQSAMPGISRCLADAEALGLSVAVASSSSTQWVTSHLDRLGLAHHFKCITCAEHTDTHKPDPAPYLRALQSLDVFAQQAIALEDSPNGITSARAAGIFTIAVPNPVTGQLDLTAANLLIPSLDQFPLRELLQIAEAATKAADA